MRAITAAAGSAAAAVASPAAPGAGQARYAGTTSTLLAILFLGFGAVLLSGTNGPPLAWELGYGLAHLGVGLWLLWPGVWARSAAIVLSILNLLAIPYGTLFGLYGLWSLVLRERAERWAGGKAPPRYAAPLRRV